MLTGPALENTLCSVFQMNKRDIPQSLRRTLCNWLSNASNKCLSSVTLLNAAANKRHDQLFYFSADLLPPVLYTCSPFLYSCLHVQEFNLALAAHRHRL